jgi:hypothetical protein
MRSKTFKLAILAALLLSAGAVQAQQHQQFGRDSAYAVPGASSSNGQDSTNALWSNDPSAAGSVNTGGPVGRCGRDSSAANQMAAPTARVTANVAAVQRFGRDSLYVGPSQTGTETKYGTAAGSGDGKGHGG